jgi:hypothetical protein
MAARWLTLRTAAPRLGKSETALRKLLARAARRTPRAPDGTLRIPLGSAAVATQVGRHWRIYMLEAAP